MALYEWFCYKDHVWEVPSLWHGGMATHGVLLGAVIGTLVFCRLRNKSFLAMADEVVIPGAVLMALGRIGNHMNGEVYGSVTDAAWAMEFPYAVRCRHTVALYDGVKNLLLVPILRGIRIVSLRWNRYLPPETHPGVLRALVQSSTAVRRLLPEVRFLLAGIGRG